MREERNWRYTVSLPGHAKFDAARTAHDTMVTVPHEALNDEVLNDPGLLGRVGTMTWPPAYGASPIVRGADRPVLPLALCLDGVPSTTRDGILGFWVYNLVSMRRHLFAVLRKSNLRKCGRGRVVQCLPDDGFFALVVRRAGAGRVSGGQARPRAMEEG